MRAVHGPRAGILPGRGARLRRERAARGRPRGGAVSVRALVLGGSRSGKSAFAEGRAKKLGGQKVLYVATAIETGDPDLRRRVMAHRERRPAGWGTLEVGGEELAGIHGEAQQWEAVLLDSLTLWVSARMARGDDEAEILEAFERFLRCTEQSTKPFLLVSDEVGMGIVPENEQARRFRDALGLVNQRAAAAAEAVYLCVAGLPVRIK